MRRLSLLLALLVLGTSVAFMHLERADAAGGTRWVNDLAYGSKGGGFYWDPGSGQVWTAERGWHFFSPNPARAAAPLWVNDLTYGSRGAGFYWDPLTNQVWTAERNWHYYDPFPNPVVLTIAEQHFIAYPSGSTFVVPWAAVVTNPTSNQAVWDVVVIATFYDAQNRVIDGTQLQTARVLAPNQTTVIGAPYPVLSRAPARMVLSFTQGNVFPVQPVTGDPYKVSGVTLSVGGPSALVTGNVTSPFDSTTHGLAVGCLVYRGSEVVGIGFVVLPDIGPFATQSATCPISNQMNLADATKTVLYVSYRSGTYNDV